MSAETEYTALVSAITAPAHIDNDGLVYFLFNLVDVVPDAPEKPWVLYLDTTKPRASKYARRVAEAFVTGERVKIALEPERKSRVEWVKLEG